MSAQLPKPPIDLQTLAAILPGAELVGDGSVTVSEMVHPMMVNAPDNLVLIIDPAALAVLQAGVVQAAIVAKEIPIPEGALKGYIKVERPKHALAYLLNIFEKPVHAADGVHPSAVIEDGAQVHPTAKVGANSTICTGAKVGESVVVMPNVTVGAQAIVGNNTLLHSGVRIGERVLVGNNVIIHNNASIGSDGFSFVTPEKGSVEAAKSGQSDTVSAKNTEIIRINSIGTVVIEDNVEIGACTCIDRSTIGATLIKKGTKLDNLVQVGHNNTIGENCMIVSQVGIAGSCKIGDRVVVAGQAGFADHIKVGDDAIVVAQAGIMRDIEPETVVAGSPAQPAKDFFKMVSNVNKLTEVRKEMRAMKKEMEELRLQVKMQQKQQAKSEETATV